MKGVDSAPKKDAVKSLSAADFFSSSFNTGSSSLNMNNNTPAPAAAGNIQQPKPAISPQKTQNDLMSIIDIPPFLQK